MLFCRLTPELSRPVAGRRTRASVAQSTRPTPRHGVGLNDLLGGKDASEGETLASLPKTEAQALERASVNFRSAASEAVNQMQLTSRRRSPLPKPASATHATCERAPQCNRRDSELTNQPKSRQSEAEVTAEQPMQLSNAFLPPNAGVKPRRTRRMGASIARTSRSFNGATTRRRLERLVRREGSRGE